MTALEELLESIAEARSALDDLCAEQNEDSDESNESNLQQATAALDSLEAAAGDIVP